MQPPNSELLGYDDARLGYHKNGENRHKARREYVAALQVRAEKRKAYRKAKAVAFAKHRADGKAQEESKLLAEADASQFELEADMADAEAKGLAALLEQLKDDRATIRHLSDWGREAVGD